MKLLLRAHSNDENYDADIAYMVVDVTPEMVRSIIRRRHLFSTAHMADKDCWQMFFWAGEQQCIAASGVKLIDALQDELDEKDFVPLSGDLDVDPDSVQRTECDQMVISEEGVSWYSLPKYCNGLEITSCCVPYGVFT